MNAAPDTPRAKGDRRTGQRAKQNKVCEYSLYKYRGPTIHVAVHMLRMGKGLHSSQFTVRTPTKAERRKLEDHTFGAIGELPGDERKAIGLTSEVFCRTDCDSSWFQAEADRRSTPNAMKDGVNERLEVVSPILLFSLEQDPAWHTFHQTQLQVHPMCEILQCSTPSQTRKQWQLQTWHSISKTCVSTCDVVIINQCILHQEMYDLMGRCAILIAYNQERAEWLAELGKGDDDWNDDDPEDIAPIINIPAWAFIPEELLLGEGKKAQQEDWKAGQFAIYWPFPEPHPTQAAGRLVYRKMRNIVGHVVRLIAFELEMDMWAVRVCTGKQRLIIYWINPQHLLKTCKHKEKWPGLYQFEEALVNAPKGSDDWNEHSGSGSVDEMEPAEDDEHSDDCSG